MYRRATILGGFIAALVATQTAACGRPVCPADPEALALFERVTFDDQPSGYSPGLKIDGVLALPGASFGERFAGQHLDAADTFDLVLGPAFGPLVLLAGDEGRNLSILRIATSNMLSGDGPLGYPREAATGEGAIAVLFARDQSAVRLHIEGGEGGRATVAFFARDGRMLDSHAIDLPERTMQFGFTRAGEIDDIAGLVITNSDPQGLALDELAFGSIGRLSRLGP